MSSYSRGVYFERRVASSLRDRDWTVERSPMSRGPADLTAQRELSAETVILKIQCKFSGRNASDAQRGYLTQTEWNALVTEARRAEALPIVAFNDRRGKICYRLLLDFKQGRKRQPWCDWSWND